MEFDSPPDGYLAARIRRGSYFFLNTPRPGAQPMFVCAGQEECEPGFRIERPSFRYHAVEFLAGGEWTASVGGKSRRAGPGTVLVYGPHKGITLAASGNGPHLKFFLNLAGAGTGRLLAQSGIDGSRFFHIDHMDRVAQLFGLVLSCRDLPAKKRPLASCMLAKALVARIGAERTLPHARNASPDHAFERCRRHMDQHYTEITSIGEAARSCHVTPEYFSRLFRRFAGTTAERYLTTLRANHAARMLAGDSGPSIKEIAHRIGYKDPYHFSRAFKSVHGVSPKMFRGH
jgi:AraC-like DNA-binding protein